MNHDNSTYNIYIVFMSVEIDLIESMEGLPMVNINPLAREVLESFQKYVLGLLFLLCTRKRR